MSAASLFERIPRVGVDLPRLAQQAPNLTVDADSAIERRLCAVYQEWREHFETCPTCNGGSWFEPDFVVRPCRVGALRFQAWNRLACASSIAK